MMQSETQNSMRRPPRVRQRHPLVLVLIAVAVGMIVDRYVASSFVAWCVTAAAALMLWFACRVARHEHLAQLPLLLAATAIAGAWHHDRWHLFAVDDIGRYADVQAKAVCIEGVTRSLPRYIPVPPADVMRIVPAEDSTRVELDITGIRDGETWHACSGRSVLYVGGKMADHAVGTRLRVYGMIVAPRPQQNPGEFDFAAHSRGDRTLARLTAAQEVCVVPLDAGDSWSVAAAFEQARRRGHDMLWRHIDEKHAGLAAAVLLGEREYIDSDIMAAYVETGAVHLLSISGLHLGILAGFMFLFLRIGLVPRRLGLLLIAASVVLYARVTDSEPPVVRATVLVVTLCAGALFGRRMLEWNVLATAALLVLAMNPADLFRVGAQLSFLCIAVLAAFNIGTLFQSTPDALDRLLEDADPWPVRTLRALGKWGKQVTFTSLVVWSVTSPVVMAQFHLFTPISVVLNVLIWLPMTLAMLSGFLVLLVGGFVPVVGDLLGMICGWSFDALGAIIEGARDVPYGKFWVPGPDDWWNLVFYLLLAASVVLRKNWIAMRWRLAIVVAWIGVAFVVGAIRALPREEMVVTFLSVGHGCCAVVELPDGRTLVCDAGHMGSPDAGGRTIAGYLWSRGITRIDGIVISHADADHFNAVPYLLERFAVDQMFVSPVMFDNRQKKLGTAVVALKTAIDASDARLETVSEGQRLVVGGDVAVRVLLPPAEGVVGSDNANSVVLSIERGERRFLITGDLEGRGLSRLLDSPPIDYDVLLAPHHGSPASSPVEFAVWARPEFAIVSGGFRGELRRVEAVYGRVGAVTLHTARVGAVQATVREGALDVKTLGRRRFLRE